MKKVIILGGGVAGLSAAHELVARGFRVEVYEQLDAFGGKARSLESKGTGRDGRRDLPGEHGFRFFPAFYRNLPDTMRRIPYKLNKHGVFDNLLSVELCELAQEREKPLEVPIQFPQSLKDLERIGRTVRRWRRTGLGARDMFFFAKQMLRFMGSCDERREREYERTSWWEYIDAENRSAAYQTLLAEGFTRTLVAMKARVASTRTVATILTQLGLDLIRSAGNVDRVLNGPTNDVWIKPWTDYLRGQGVALHLNSPVAEFRMTKDGKKVEAVLIARERPDGSAKSEPVSGDYYIAAVPVEAMEALLDRDPALENRVGKLKNIRDLKVEWMNGIQFYLKRDVSIVRGHTVYLDSPWALTSISQRQVWDKAYDFSQIGNGQVRGILSVCISDWNTPGDRRHKKPASECNETEIAEEVWEQIKAHLQWSKDDALYDDDLIDSFLDPSVVTPEDLKGAQLLRLRQTAGQAVELRDAVIKALGPGVLQGAKLSEQVKERELERFTKTNAKVFNTTPLLINTVDSLRLRPGVVTQIPNLFLASDYVRTSTDLATMEAANEAARLAVNAILKASGSREQPCRVFHLEEPFFFEPLKKLDKVMLDVSDYLDDLADSRGSKTRRKEDSAERFEIEAVHESESTIPLDAEADDIHALWVYAAEELRQEDPSLTDNDIAKRIRASDLGRKPNQKNERYAQSSIARWLRTARAK